MATDFDMRILEAAGLAMRELRLKTNPTEFQVALSLLLSYYCNQFEVTPENLVAVLAQNTRSVLQDPVLLARVVEHVHNASGGDILLPQGGAEPEHRYKVGDLLRKHKH